MVTERWNEPQALHLFAITVNADEREAHIREVEQFGQSLPEGS
jgi:hypothetical protein